ncbi:MAG: hypothetical protein LBF12_07160 [Christensenellaceae bacterium]|jgi:hypothetical protein|nr:hypothetical protein [Christensenellaceae bacterium]
MKFQTKTNFRVFALVVILTFFIVMSYILCKQTLDENSINADITESKWEYYCSAPSDSRSLTTTMSFDYKVSGESSLDLIQESDSRSFLLPVANISTVEEAHEYSYSFNGKYDNTKYTGRYDTSENNDTGSQRDLCIGNSVTTLSSTDIKLTQIVTYEFSLEFSDEMKAAVQNKRVEFAVNSLLINDIYMGATEYNLRGDLKTGNFTSQVKSSTFNVDLYYNSSVKMYSSPADPWKSPDRGKTGDKEKIEYAPSISSKIWFTPSANSKLDLTLTLTLAGEQSAWVQWGNYFVINSAPKIEIGVRYKTSDIAFKTETNDATAGYIDTFLGGSSDHDQTGANITYKVGIDSAYGESFIKAKAVANPGYCFLFWQPAKGTTFTNHDAYKPEVVPIALYNHPYSEVVDGKLTYVAVFEEIKYTDLSADHNLSYSYNGVGQGPRAYLTYNFPFTHQAQHMYSSISGNYWDNATNQTSSATLILNKPVVVDEYNYTITFARTIDDTYFLVGKKEDVQYEINKYKPSGSITENGVSLKTYYFGQTISSDYIQSQLEDGQSYLSDNYVLGSNNVPLGKLLGSYKFENSEYNNFMSENIRLVSNAAAQKIIFTPNDSNNIDPITLTGSVTITVTKTTLRIGYFYNGTFSEGLNSVELNTLTYGQNRIQLGVETKLVLYNPYIAEDELQSELQSMNDSKFAYAPFSVTDWGIITQRPAATEKPTEATLQLSLSGNIPNTSTSFSSVYNLPNEQIIIKYNVVKASLVFGGEENKKLTFKYNNYLGALSTVYSNIILMYGQGLKSVDITSTGTIGSNVEGYIDSGEIRFSWYKQNEGGAFLDENLADYYEQNFLTVLDSTNPNGTTKNYYCIKADWMKVGGDAENPNYESLIFYNQSITIEKAKLNSGVQFQQSTEVDSENPVVKSIIYGQNVANALSTNINVGTTLNVVNQDLEVYYKIEWIIDNGGNSIATLSNYPYALVENSGQYAVKVTILKWNGLSYVTDSDNYEQNGVFTRNETGGAFAFALLSVTRATQNFYLKIDNNLVELNNMNLVSSMIAINDNVYEEKTENLVINGDTDIDLETLYIKDNNTIKIVLYTSAVMYKQSETLNISAKAVATVSAHYPNIYSVTSEPVSNYSIEYISGSPYTRIEFTILLAQKAATTFGVLSLKLGQYDSGYELNNPSGGNYFSKEWNPAQNNDPFTIFIKANKNPEGIKAENIYNPDDSTDVQLYSYKEFYGDPIKIEPLSTVPGVLSYPANDDYITIKEDMNTDNETYLITSITTGSYKLLYTAPGYVDINNPIAVTPYMPINQEIWIYFAKKQSTVNILINSKINTKYTYGELSPEVNYTTNGFVDGDFDEIKPLVKLYFLSDNSDYKSNVILNVNEYYIGAFIDSFSSVIEGFSLEDIAKAKDIAKRYNITFNPVKIEVDPKTVIITFTDSSQFTIDNEIKVFEIDYFDDKLLNANNYPYTYTFVGILEGEDLNEVIGDELTRPSVRAMNTSNPSEHYPISARPDAGTYEIKLYVPVNCPAVNYEFDIERAILRVKTRDATLNFDEVEQDYTSTSYTFVNNAKVSGIKGATSPTGSLIIKFLKTGTVVSENTEFLTSLQHAGVYDVYVSYLSGNLDNYNDTDKVFSEYITINRIDPIVTLPSHNSTYDGIQIT